MIASRTHAWDVLCLIFAVIVFFLRWLFATRFGFAGNAIRDDAETAEGLGLPTKRYKTIGRAIAACFVGLSGAVFGNMIGFVEPRFIDMEFAILDDLRNTEGKTIIMVEQNAEKGLEFADIGYVLVSGEVALAGTGDELLANPQVGRRFLGG